MARHRRANSVSRLNRRRNNRPRARITRVSEALELKTDSPPFAANDKRVVLRRQVSHEFRWLALLPLATGLVRSGDLINQSRIWEGLEVAAATVAVTVIASYGGESVFNSRASLTLVI